MTNIYEKIKLERDRLILLFGRVLLGGRMNFKNYLNEYFNEKKIDKMCKQLSIEDNCNIIHFRDFKEMGRGSFHYIPGWGDNFVFEISYDFFMFDKNNKLIEGISPEQYPLDRYNGGMIIFSTSVNVVKLDKSKIKNFFKQKFNTIVNKMKKDKKLMSVIKKFPELKEIGISIGNYFKGKYISKSGEVYDDKSTSIEILGISSKILIKLATEMAREFKQETVLLKDWNTGRSIFIDRL